MTKTWWFDRNGFPYRRLPDLGLAMALLPLTKAQAEIWLGEPNGPGHDWYETILGLSPRRAWRKSSTAPDWHLLLTGILPEDADRLVGWLGDGLRLPSAAEWRSAERSLSKMTLTELNELLDSGEEHPAAAAILRQRLAVGGVTRACYLEAGILEWITRPHASSGALGRPSADLPIRLILDPQAFDPVVPLRPERHSAFGARLVRPLTRGEA